MKKSDTKIGLGNGCPYYKKCGGCQLQNLTYDEQLAHKQCREISLLGKFGHVSDIEGMKSPMHYRHKVQASFRTLHGKTASGIYQSSTGKIAAVASCLIEDEKADKIITDIRKIADKLRIRPSVDGGMLGFLRFVLVRTGYYSGDAMVVLATTKAKFPEKDKFVSALTELHPEVKTVVQIVSTAKTELVLGDKQFVLYGDGYIEDSLCGLTFRISPKSFYQVNPEMTERLYSYAVNHAGLTGKEKVLDAYCGTGTIGLIAASKAGEVIGVESNGDAVRDAKYNAKRNGIDNVRFVKADATEFIAELADAGETVDVLIMDPPRAGSTAKFLAFAVALAPKKIVYISCNPETLARDLRTLKKGGYMTEKIKPFDLFPMTDHVETVVVLTKTE